MRKLSRQQKAANTRKSRKELKEIAEKIIKRDWKEQTNSAKQETLKIIMPNDYPIVKPYTPTPALTLCGQLEDAIMLLEIRISNATAKINSLM